MTFSNASEGYASTLQEDVAGGTLTIGPGVTVSGGTGTIGYNSNLGGPSNVSFVNEGTIDADAAGTITLAGDAWSNTGTVEATGEQHPRPLRHRLDQLLGRWTSPAGRSTWAAASRSRTWGRSPGPAGRST